MDIKEAVCLLTEQLDSPYNKKSDKVAVSGKACREVLRAIDLCNEIDVPGYAVPGLLEAVKMAYRKHHVGDDSIGWEELSDKLCNVLCKAMGDAGFQKWLREIPD